MLEECRKQVFEAQFYRVNSSPVDSPSSATLVPPALPPRLQRLRPALRCPACLGALDDAPEGFACPGCGARYPNAAGRPVIITPAGRGPVEAYLASEDGQRMVREYEGRTEPTQTTAPAGWLSKLKPPGIMYRYFDDPRAGPAGAMFEARGGREPLVLNVGGGPYRVSEGEITLNIGPFPGVDLVADGQRIPVADATFDAVFSLAVLEHVPDAPRVVAEMLRVLKPGGWLYSEVPFIWFFHGYPSDFQRYTLKGMERLFGGLEGARFGMTHGPVSAALQSGNMALQLLLPRKPRLVRKVFNGLYRLVLFPFKYLDILLEDHPEAHTVAGGFYVIGRKPGGPVG